MTATGIAKQSPRYGSASNSAAASRVFCDGINACARKLVSGRIRMCPASQLVEDIDNLDRHTTATFEYLSVQRPEAFEPLIHIPRIAILDFRWRRVCARGHVASVHDNAPHYAIPSHAPVTSRRMAPRPTPPSPWH